MKEIELCPEGVALLHEIVQARSLDLSLLDSSLGIQIRDEEELQHLMDLVDDALIKSGFGNKWEPTERGQLLESIGDALARSRYE